MDKGMARALGKSTMGACGLISGWIAITYHGGSITFGILLSLMGLVVSMALGYLAVFLLTGEFMALFSSLDGEEGD